MESFYIAITFNSPIWPENQGEFMGLLEEEVCENWNLGEGIVIDSMCIDARAAVQLGISRDDGTVVVVDCVTSEDCPEEYVEKFVERLKQELEFNDLRDGHWHKTGWGMGKSKVIRVERKR